MRKIYCKDLKKIILFNQCYHAKRENCNSCGFNLKRIKLSGKPYSPRAKLLKFPPRNDELINEIKENIPLILNLHKSFWRDPCFVNWQFLRLNKKYRIDIEKPWKAIREYQDYLVHKYGDLAENFGDIKDIELFQKNFTPRLNDIYSTYEERLTLSREGNDFLNRYPRITPSVDIREYEREYGEEITWKGRILSAKFYTEISKKLPISGNEEKKVLIKKGPLIEIECGSPSNKMKIEIDRLANLIPSIIHYHVRFPFSYLVDNLFMYAGPSPKGKKMGRPRKEDWPTNLLIYELSGAGMKNMEIARLFFGIEKSTEFRPGQIKHPILVEIAKIKERMESYISNIYPQN